ncbi:MAG TPA: GNAT family protein [Myxococcaceae bacterium]
MVRLRTASREDLEYLTGLAQDPSVAPFLAPVGLILERLEVLLSERAADGREPAADPGPEGMFVIETETGQPVGGLALHLYSRNSRICELSTLMVDPAAQHAGVGKSAVSLACHRVLVEHGFHRIQAETYGDNLRAQRLFERVGFVPEGRRRSAYWRRDQWLDSVLYGLLAEELRDVSGSAG